MGRKMMPPPPALDHAVIRKAHSMIASSTEFDDKLKAQMRQALMSKEWNPEKGTFFFFFLSPPPSSSVVRPHSIRSTLSRRKETSFNLSSPFLFNQMARKLSTRAADIEMKPQNSLFQPKNGQFRSKRLPQHWQPEWRRPRRQLSAATT